MTAADQSKALQALLKRLAEQFPQAAAAGSAEDAGARTIDPSEPILAEFLRSFLIWEATASKAAAALKRLASAVVDFNELRVCLPDEWVRVLGERYPRAQERAQRLRAALNDVYFRQHAVTLQPLADMSKRDAKAYLDSLDGVPPFVASRVLALSLGGHAAPVDRRILHCLVTAGIAPADADPESAAACLERRLRAGELAGAYLLLQAWSDHEPGPPASAEPGAATWRPRAARPVRGPEPAIASAEPRPLPSRPKKEEPPVEKRPSRPAADRPAKGGNR